MSSLTSKAPDPQRKTHGFHGVSQSVPLLERHGHLAPPPMIVAGAALYIGQNLLGLLQLLKPLHWKTRQER